MTQGKVAGICVKRAHRAPLEPIARTNVTVEGGIEGNVAQVVHRRLTFISKEQWEQICRELGTALPWQTRRANILIESLRMSDLIGKTLQIGELEIKIEGETKPCGRMDEAFQGLKGVLMPECRGGVHGRVVRGGEIAVGDTIIVRA